MKFIPLVILISLISCGKEVSIKHPYPGLLSGPTHSQINKTLPVGGNVSDKFVLTPDNKKIVYISDENTAGINELMVADIDGTNRRVISQPLDMGSNVHRFKVDPSSLKVAYIADPVAGFQNLFTVNLDGSSRYQVNSGLPSSSHSIGDFQWMPNGHKLVYSSDELNPSGTYGLYISNFDASSKITLSNGPVGQESFEIAPNGSRIVYRYGFNNPVLRSILPNGTDDQMLNSAFTLPLGAKRVWNFVISPDSSKVALLSNQLDETKDEIHVVNIDGTGSRVKVSGTLVTGGDVRYSSNNAKLGYDFTEDSSSIVFIADKDTDTKQELYIVSITGAGLIKLSGSSMIADGDVVSFKRMGNKTLFLADMEINGSNELYLANNDGSGFEKINSDLIAGETVGHYTTDGSNISYLMDKGSPGIYSPYLNNSLGSDEKGLISLSGGLGFYDAAKPFAEQLVIANGVLFFRGAINNNINNLYSFNINNNELKQVNESGGNVLLSNDSLGSSFIITPNGTYSVYRKAMPDGNNLFSSKN